MEVFCNGLDTVGDAAAAGTSSFCRLWQDDSETNQCSRCRQIFSFFVSRHHCRKCGELVCGACTQQKLLVPEEEFVARPKTWLQKQGVFSENNAWQEPQPVCDACAEDLLPGQLDLRSEISKFNMESDTVQDQSYMPSIDFALETELANASRFFKSFVSDGEEKIPRNLLSMAKGFVFLTVCKIAVGVSIRYGTGFVVAQMDDGSWSAPSAIALSGVGWGMQVGGESSQIMLILTSAAAVRTFQSRGQLTIGAELSVAVGPIGKSVETDVTTGDKGTAHAFSYAHARGLFVGASLEACMMVQRRNTNKAFYGEVVDGSQLLSSEYPIPRGAEHLYRALDDLVTEGGSSSEEKFNILELKEARRREAYASATKLRSSKVRLIASNVGVLVEEESDKYNERRTGH
jgi:SH3 domain-containing YSC84-like protein 1